MFIEADELFERDENRDFRCTLCGRICSDRGRRGHGAMGKVSHGRKHVREGRAEEHWLRTDPVTIAFRITRAGGVGGAD